MATKGRYDLGMENLLGATISWSTTVRAFPTKGYTFASTHDHLSDIGAGSRAATAVAIATPTKTDGTASCDPVTWTAPTAAQVINGVVFYYHTGTESTSTLIAFIGEDSGGTPFAFTTNGSDVVFTPNALGIFSI